MYNCFGEFILTNKSSNEILFDIDKCQNGFIENLTPDLVNIADFIGFNEEFTNKNIKTIKYLSKNDINNENSIPMTIEDEFKRIINKDFIATFNIFVIDYYVRETDENISFIYDRENIINQIIKYLDNFNYVYVKYYRESYWNKE